MAETVILHSLHPPGLAEMIAGLPDVDVVVPDSDQAVAQALQGARILVTYRWDDAFITESLRWVQSLSAGMEQFPLEALSDAGVVLTSARGVHAPAVAEHAIALLLSLTRSIGPAMRDVPTRTWAWGRPGYELGGRTLGIVGLGSIGEHAARLGAGLGMRVIGTKAHPEGYGGAAERVFGPEETVAMCAEADAVIVAVPHHAGAGPVVAAPELVALGAGWLVNVGRGQAVDEAALIEALTSGELRGAGLDVFAAEPLPPESPLWDLATVVITPHSAWASDRLAERMFARFTENLEAFRGDGTWVDPWTVGA